VNFIQKNGIVTAMIGLLTAIPGTRLYERLQKENRLLFKPSGNNTDVSGSLNFIPKMDRQTIIDGYRWVMNTIYSPEMYHQRVLAFLRSYSPRARTSLAENDLLLSFPLVSGTDDQKSSQATIGSLKRLSKYQSLDIVTVSFMDTILKLPAQSS
jgi:hypothetical protein